MIQNSEEKWRKCVNDLERETKVQIQVLSFSCNQKLLLNYLRRITTRGWKRKPRNRLKSTNKQISFFNIYGYFIYSINIGIFTLRFRCSCNFSFSFTIVSEIHTNRLFLIAFLMEIFKRKKIMKIPFSCLPVFFTAAHYRSACSCIWVVLKILMRRSGWYKKRTWKLTDERHEF